MILFCEKNICSVSFALGFIHENAISTLLIFFIISISSEFFFSQSFLFIVFHQTRKLIKNQKKIMGKKVHRITFHPSPSQTNWIETALDSFFLLNFLNFLSRGDICVANFMQMVLGNLLLKICQFHLKMTVCEAKTAMTYFGPTSTLNYTYFEFIHSTKCFIKYVFIVYIVTKRELER